MVEEEVDMGWGKLAGRPDHGPGGHRWPMGSWGWSGLTSATSGRTNQRPGTGSSRPMRSRLGWTQMTTDDQSRGIWWRVGELETKWGKQHNSKSPRMGGHLVRGHPGRRNPLWGNQHILKSQNHAFITKDQEQLWGENEVKSASKEMKWNDFLSTFPISPQKLHKCCHNWCFCERLSSPGL